MNIQKERLVCTAARGPVYVSTIILYSLAYDAADVTDNDNLATALSFQIQISIALIDMVRKPAIDPIVLAKRWGIAHEKAQNPIQDTSQRGIRTMLHLSLLRQFKTNDRNLYYHHLANLVFSGRMFPVQCPEGATDVHKFMPQTLDGLDLSL